MPYKQYRTHKFLSHQLMNYMPPALLFCFIITILVAAEYLHIDWNRLLFNQVNQILIEGEYKNIDGFEIKQLLLPLRGSTINKSKMDTIAKQLEELPWVKNALIKYNWLDNTLVVILQQRTAVAYWRGQALLDADAEVFVSNLVDNEDMPILDADVGREKHMLDFYRQLSEWLSPVGFQVIHVHEDATRSYTVQLADAPRLILGRHLVEQRIKRFIDAYRAGFVDYIDRVACIDLRYLDGFAVRWKKDGAVQSC